MRTRPAAHSVREELLHEARVLPGNIVLRKIRRDSWMRRQCVADLSETFRTKVRFNRPDASEGFRRRRSKVAVLDCLASLRVARSRPARLAPWSRSLRLWL